MKYKPGYYVVCPAGTSDMDIVWSDGESLFYPGSEEPVDIGFIVMMTKEPLDMNAIPMAPFVDPFESNLDAHGNGEE